MLKLSACDDKDPQEQQDPLDRMSHPLGFAVSAAGDAVRYDAGLVLGNTLVAVTVTVLHLAVTFAWTAAKRDRSSTPPLLRGAVWSHFPGFTSTIHVYLLPLIAQSAVSCIVKGTAVGVVIGVWGTLLWVCVASTLVFHTVRTLSRCMECTTPAECDTGPLLLRPRFLWAALPSTRHETETLCSCLGAYFEDYLYHGRWWLCVEVATAVVSGVLGGLAGTGSYCLGIQVATLVPNAAYLALVTWLRPHQRLLDFFASVGVGVLLLISSIAACAGSADAAVDAALIASLVGFLPAIAAPYKMLQQYRNLQRQKKHQRDEHRRHAMLHSASALLLPEVFQADNDDRGDALGDVFLHGHTRPVTPPLVHKPAVTSLPSTDRSPQHPPHTTELCDEDFDVTQDAVNGNIGILLDELDGPHAAPSTVHHHDDALDALLL